MCRVSLNVRRAAAAGRRHLPTGSVTNGRSNRFVAAPLAIVLLAASHNAIAQAPIGAGGQIQQIPPAPVPEKATPELSVPQRHVPPIAAPDNTRFVVNSLQVTGQTRFTEAELIAAANFHQNRQMTLPELQSMAANITSYYNQRGYFVAQAYLPPQDITDGAVTIAVIEGRYGEINLNNHAPVSNVVITRVLDGLHTGDLVNAAPLERRLLIISDIPGVVVNSTLAPGAAVGTSDLIVNVTPAPRISGSVEADNWGNPYTGAYRLGGTINYADPFGIGDVVSLRALGSTTGGLGYGRISYQAQAGDATVGVAFTGFTYHLGKQFTDLYAHGNEGIASVYASYPIIRSYSNNLAVLVDFDERFFQDDIGVPSIGVGKRASVIIVQLSGDHRDSFGGGGWSTYAIAGTFGDLDIETQAARTADAETARTYGGYAKVSGSVSRLQHLIGPLSLYGEVRGQLAAKNLDISEQMELGGANGVRAYPEGEAYGDQGYIATLEARLLLPRWQGPLPGQVQLITFVDTGSVDIRHSPYGGGQNNLTRTGVGGGIVWSQINNFAVTATYAHMVGGAAATSYPDDSGQFWVQLVKYF
jgi:hemolysin activation/secretion protein